MRNIFLFGIALSMFLNIGVGAYAGEEISSEQKRLNGIQLGASITAFGGGIGYAGYYTSRHGQKEIILSEAQLSQLKAVIGDRDNIPSRLKKEVKWKERLYRGRVDKIMGRLVMLMSLPFTIGGGVLTYKAVSASELNPSIRSSNEIVAKQAAPGFDGETLKILEQEKANKAIEAQ